MARIKYKYKWDRLEEISGVSAQVAGKALEALRMQNNGSLTKEAIVEAARDEKSPLHNFFEWDDSAAAEKYREEQARHLICNIITVISNEEDNEPTEIRVFTSAENGDGDRFYTTTTSVLSDSEQRERVLNEFVEDITALQRKYTIYKNAAVNRVFDKIHIEVAKIVAVTKHKKPKKIIVKPSTKKADKKLAVA